MDCCPIGGPCTVIASYPEAVVVILSGRAAASCQRHGARYRESIGPCSTTGDGTVDLWGGARVHLLPGATHAFHKRNGAIAEAALISENSSAVKERLRTTCHGLLARRHSGTQRFPATI